jgi:hypothetical protein
MTRKIPCVWMVLFCVGGLLSLWSYQALAADQPLPIIDHLDDGAPLWTAYGSWTLSEATRFGDSGMGWGNSTTLYFHTLLAWNKIINLTTAVTPRLRFASRLHGTSESVSAKVMIFDDEGGDTTIDIVPSSEDWTEVVIDLTAHRGHHIRLNWDFEMGDWEDSWVIDDVIVEDTFSPLTTPPIVVSVTLTPTLSWPCLAFPMDDSLLVGCPDGASQKTR